MKIRLFRNMLNKVGPRTNPYGTPLTNEDHELKLGIIFVVCQRLLR